MITKVLRLTTALALPVFASVASAASDYAVIVSKSTHSEPDWQPVVEALRKKHDGIVIEFEGSVGETLPQLRKHFPKYVGIVAKPEETGRKFVAQIHHLSRLLDDDPYPDLIWGIITGYQAADALRIATHAKPLEVNRALTGTVGSPLEDYSEGVMFSELTAKAMWKKNPGEKVRKKTCSQDTTKLIVDSLNNDQPDVFITSGHATERDWQLGFSYRNGYFRCQNGQLYGLDTKGQRHPVNSPNPKVHLPVGNCLIAHIPDRECMALALMHSAGVHQMVGYTIPTWYGYGGWGVKDYFSELQAGRFTLAEAHFANQIALIHNLETLPANHRDRRGLQADRDVVVLYGDPAWEARLPERPLPWSQTLSKKDGTYSLTLTANERGDWDNRPVVQFLPKRLTDIKLITGSELNPVVADNFILIKFNKGVVPMKGNRGEAIPIKGDFEKGETFVIKFTAKEA